MLLTFIVAPLVALYAMRLKQRTKAEIEFNEEDWHTEEKPYSEELEEAIKEINENQEGEQFIDAGSDPYILHPHWNHKTESVWVGVFGYSLGLEAKPDED